MSDRDGNPANCAAGECGPRMAPSGFQPGLVQNWTGPEEANGPLSHAPVLWITAVYLGLFIIRPWELLIPELGEIHFERLYAIFMVLSVMMTVGLRCELNSQTTAVLAFLGAMGVAGVYASNAQLAREACYVYFTVVVCYFVLVSVIENPSDLLFIVGAYLSFMGLYLGKALWEFFVHGHNVRRMDVTRLIGIEETFGGPNKLAMSVVVSLPLWLFLWRFRGTITSGMPEKWQKRITYGLVLYLVLAVVSVVLTNSRTGMVGLCVFVVLSCLRGGKAGRLLLTLCCALLLIGAAWFVLPEEQKNRMQTIWNPEAGPANAEESKQGRVTSFWVGIEMFRRSPVTGVGPGNFKYYRTQNVDGVFLSPHNLLAQMLAEVGILGATAFVLMVGTTLLNCRTARQLARGRPERELQVLAGLGQACRNSILLLLVEGIAGHNLYRYNWLWLAAFCLLAVKFAQEIRERADEPGENIHQVPLHSSDVPAVLHRLPEGEIALCS